MLAGQIKSLLSFARKKKKIKALLACRCSQMVAKTQKIWLSLQKVFPYVELEPLLRYSARWNLQRLYSRRVGCIRTYNRPEFLFVTFFVPFRFLGDTLTIDRQTLLSSFSSRFSICFSDGLRTLEGVTWVNPCAMMKTCVGNRTWKL